MPLSITFDNRGFNDLLIDGWPERIVILVIAAMLWVTYWLASRHTRVAGP